METNSKTASNVASNIKAQARNLASLPNRFRMCDARAIAFADLGTALELCGVYLADFITTSDKTAARKYLPLATRVSEALSLLAGADESPVVGLAIVSASEGLVKAHSAFSAHIESLLTANRATVQA